MSKGLEVIDANTMVGTHPFRKLEMSVGKLIRLMDTYQIQRSMVVSSIGVFYDYIEGNEATLKAASESDRLIPVATINPIEYFGGEDDCRAIRDRGFRIFKFQPEDQKWPLFSAAFAEVLRHLAPLKAPIMIDLRKPGEATAMAQVAGDYPAPVIMCGLPLDALSEALVVMRDSPNLYLETHELCVPGVIKLAADRVGVERIVFGSGTPRRSAASPLQNVFLSELSEEDKQKVLAGNIKGILEAAG